MLNPPPCPDNEPTPASVGRFRTRAILFAAWLVATTPHALATYAFDSGELLGPASALPAWSEMLERHATQTGHVEACIEDQDACPRRARALHLIVEKGAELPRDKQIQLVNRYVNRKSHRLDRRRTTHTDEGKVVRISHWKTLWEFMERGGDCEDYATTKYFLLRRLGFAPEDLRVVVATTALTGLTVSWRPLRRRNLSGTHTSTRPTTGGYALRLRRHEPDLDQDVPVR